MLNMIQHLFAFSIVMPNLFRHLETLKRVQGDSMGVLAMRVRVAFACHAELVSASVDPETSSG